jgi:hypothetical protein
MTINRTTLLDLPLPVTGTESGAWGNITNNGLSQYVDIAVAGMNALTSSDFTAGALTISNTLGTSAATNIAAGSAQYATIKVSSLAQNSTITAPASNRSYRIINADSTYNLTIKASGQTGITFLPGQTGVVAFTGTDYEVVGVVNAASSTDNAVPKFDGTTGQIIQNTGVTIDDSNNVSGVAQLNATTADLTNIEVTNIKAKDGTASATIADSTGVMTIATLVGTNDATVNGLTVGRGAGAVSTNTAVGASALAANTSGADNVAIGRSAASGATTASFGTYVGSLSGNSGITGNNNTALGYYAYGSGSSGANNTALGVQALYLNTTASSNTAVGYQSLYANTTGTLNTAIGERAATANTIGIRNVVVGNTAFSTNTTGSYNIAIGMDSLARSTTSSYNTAVGTEALAFNTTASNNTAVGYQAGYNNETGDANVYIGRLAGFTGTTARLNTFVGDEAGGLITTGASNTFIGNDSGYAVTTGSNNSILGAYNGNQGGLDIRTADNYIVLSDGAGNPLVSTADNQTVALEGAVPNSGTGITFPAAQSASSNAHTLDDYEEGSWTPVAIGGTTTGTGTYGLQVGRYTKIGQVCFFQMTLGWSAHTGTGDLILAGLPFTSLNAGGGGGQSVATLGYNNGLAFTNQPVMFIPTNNTRISLTQTTTGGGVSGIPMDTAVSELVVNGHYIVA